ncbi:hypothetical protein GCM10009846_23800 [Agrococcus versicolor]|uniref:Lipoprotein n=1 Tax=Agrococcus versicolor TaxID=501482 RepID=A0ABP5MKJ7_9MICO
MLTRASSLCILVVALALSGCSSAAPSEQLGTIDSIETLRDAYVAAGGACEWEAIDERSGNCAGDAILVLTESEEQEADILATYEAVAGLAPSTVLVGENWILNAPDAAEVQDALGGEVRVFD